MCLKPQHYHKDDGEVINTQIYKVGFGPTSVGGFTQCCDICIANTAVEIIQIPTGRPRLIYRALCYNCLEAYTLGYNHPFSRIVKLKSLKELKCQDSK